MTSDDLDRMEALAKATTPGPRTTSEVRQLASVLHARREEYAGDGSPRRLTRYREADEAFIAACDPGTVLALLADARRLRAIEAVAAKVASVQEYSGLEERARLYSELFTLLRGEP